MKTSEEFRKAHTDIKLEIEKLWNNLNPLVSKKDSIELQLYEHIYNLVKEKNVIHFDPLEIKMYNSHYKLIVDILCMDGEDVITTQGYDLVEITFHSKLKILERIENGE